jgi:hypothetical protein
MEQEKLPGYYANAVQTAISPFDMTFIFSDQQPEITEAGVRTAQHPVCAVKMSLEHAKVMAIILRKTLKEHEDTLGGPIALHPQMCQQLGISPREDW